MHAFSAVGIFAILIGLLAIFYPGAITRDRRWLELGIVLVSISFGLIRAWPRTIQRVFSSPNFTIRLIKDDIFSRPGHLVIGMCDTFDTATPVIIDELSIQGQMLSRIFKNDLAELDRQLENALTRATLVGEIVKDGKRRKYALGTVAPLLQSGRRLFCIAYTEMNERNEARASVDGIWTSLSALWKEVSAYANGEIISMPVIGGGQARISQFLPAQDSVKLTILSFVLASRREKICNGLDIIVRPNDFGGINGFEIQAFLDSLVPT